jgi:adenylate cyclase
MARRTDPVSHALVVTYKYSPAIPYGVLLADDSALDEIDEALRLAEGSGTDFALGAVRITLGLALVHRDSPADRERGLKLLAEVRDMCLHQRFYMTELPIVDAYTGRETARHKDFDTALPLLRKSVEGLFREEQLG